MATLSNATGGAAEPSFWSSEAIGPDARTGSTVAFSGRRIPVLAETDVLIVGASLDACFLAPTLAKGGRAVLLASAGTSLPHGLTMCLRPWVRQQELAKAPIEIRDFLSCRMREASGGDWLLDMIKVTEGLEDQLLDAGADLLYGLVPCGVVLAGTDLDAVIFAGKGGLVAIEAGTVVDCTPEASLVRLVGGETSVRESARSGLVARYSMLCRNAPTTGSIAARSVPEIVDGRIVMHGEFAEFRVRLPLTASPFPSAVYNLEARRIAAQAGRAARAEYPDLEFARGGNSILIDPAKRIVSRSSDRQLAAPACRPLGLDNLWVCGPSVDVDDDVAAELVEPWAGPSLLPVLAEQLVKTTRTPHAGERQVRLSSATGAGIPGSCEFAGTPPVCRNPATIQADAAHLPVMASCELLVVGGGTSGMPAAMVAAENGVDTILMEAFGDVGGTHTIGGVSKYWFGRKTDFVKRLDDEALGMMADTGMPKCMGLLSCLMRARTRVLTHCLAVGTAVDGRLLTGVVVATPDGLGVIQAQHIIDATGDGDIAERAGAETEYGVRRDAMALWYSFAQYQGTNPEAKRHFDCAADPRDSVDLTRAMVSSRRRGTARTPEGFPQYYLTPRESRRIRGRERVTTTDILAERRFADMVLICRSNFDIKGIADSDLSFCGYVEWDYARNYEVQIPYRALLPQEFDNLLVIGKAYAIDHDGLALARMQRDLIAMGGVAGLAAVQAAAGNGNLATVDIKRLQNNIVELGGLSADDLKRIEGVRDSELAPVCSAALQNLVARLAKGELGLDDTVKVLARPEESLPVLRQAFAKDTDSLELARALCFLGDRAGADRLLTELEHLLGSDHLTTQRTRHHHAQPDHGYAPDAAYLVNALGRLGDTRLIPVMHRIAARIRPGRDSFSVTFSLCYAAERLGDPDCAPMLETLANSPDVCDRLLPTGSDPRETVDKYRDREAYLGLCVARVQARCGVRAGYARMIEYVADIRAPLARSAHDELAALAGRDLGYDSTAWQSWLKSATVHPLAYEVDGDPAACLASPIQRV
jgi:hypothetical protein